jgi:hypothetical protein
MLTNKHGRLRVHGPFREWGKEARKLLLDKSYVESSDGKWRRKGCHDVAEIIRVHPPRLLPPATDPRLLKWTSLRRGHVTFYKNQRFWTGRPYGWRVLKTAVSGHNGEQINVPQDCHFPSRDFDALVKHYRPTLKKQTVYEDWKPCYGGHCDRLSVKIDGREFWAKLNPETKRVEIFGSHRSLRILGSVSKRLLPKELHNYKPERKKKSRRQRLDIKLLLGR